MTTADELLGRLAALDRDGLAKVLTHRPDVLREPWPRRLDVVAARLASAESLDEAVLGLSAPQIQVLGAVQLCHALGLRPTPLAEVGKLLGSTAFESYVDDLVERALLWRDDDRLTLPDLLRRGNFHTEGLGQPVADLLVELGRGPMARLSKALGLPAGLKELVHFYRDGDRVRELFRTAPEPTRKLLQDMADGVPEAEGVLPFHTAEGWAFEHGFLISTYYGSAAMPIEVSLALRGPDHQLPFTPEEPGHATTHVGAESVEATSSAAALRLLDRVSAVLDLAAAEPLPLLKDGTIGARLIKKVAKETGATPAEIELAIDLAAQAGLLLADEPPPPRRGQKAPPPTLATDPDLVRPAPALLYRLLLTTWWDPAPPEFGTDVGALVRRLVVRLLARLEPGVAITGDLTRLAEWHAPMLLTEDFAGHVADAVEAAELLGVVAHGAVTAVGRALLSGEDLVEVTDGLVARARTTALFGTDLTAIVPGSPDARLAAALDRVADREAQGTATSWRFSPASVRRAFDQGATADGLLDELRALAAGELPQPLVYLVNDVARRHGEAQVLDVASVVVGEPAVLTELAAHRKLAKLGLRAVAPTVLTSTVDAAGTLDALREAGYSPTHHAADGSIVLPAREPAAPKVTFRDPEPDDRPPDACQHAERLLAAPPSGPSLLRGQLARAMSDRYAGRLTPKQQQLCWQLEAGIPADVVYQEDDGPVRLVIAYPELDGDALDVWSLGDHAYRRLELARIELG
ncbi:Helicase conserved C-terminal domain-containing protein [Amycolatopsis pretoriensis]|uniref:Helicase conserved C-terminal domain-containing protein n=1 Tax=Amycolatopsis pretoriensis TaxID=218821 RepID=A0A1H5QYY9_9PSEU|nr:helicase-associated domain-containing protein [Amycolatopsis pretoriensis]SEF30397.1 Helicase conserved C-terminal domain-containing protein [Amycolatopsis pretoriensis]